MSLIFNFNNLKFKRNWCGICLKQFSKYIFKTFFLLFAPIYWLLNPCDQSFNMDIRLTASICAKSLFGFQLIYYITLYDMTPPWRVQYAISCNMTSQYSGLSLLAQESSMRDNIMCSKIVCLQCTPANTFQDSSPAPLTEGNMKFLHHFTRKAIFCFVFYMKNIG